MVFLIGISNQLIQGTPSYRIKIVYQTIIACVIFDLSFRYNVAPAEIGTADHADKFVGSTTELGGH